MMINSGREWDWMDKKTKMMSKLEVKKCTLEIIDYLGSRNGFDNWWLQIEDNEESEITKKLEDIIERRVNQKEETPLCTPDNCRHGY